MYQKYAETRYQVEQVNYNEFARTTTTSVFYTDDFFEAVAQVQIALPNYHHIELFDSVAGRTLFDSSDLD